MINFGRRPTKKELKLYRRWVRYLSDSKLSQDEVHRRAAHFTSNKAKVPTDE